MDRIASKILKAGKSKKSIVAEFNRKKIIDYPKQDELFSRILDLIAEYNDEMPFASVLGILELVKDEVKERNL